MEPVFSLQLLRSQVLRRILQKVEGFFLKMAIKLHSVHVLVLLVLVCSASLAPGAQGTCGTSLRGVRGEERVRTPWTALVLLRDQLQEAHVDWIGGVVVGPSTILTSGRPFRNQSLAPHNFLIGVGISNRKEFSPDRFTQILEVAYIRPHPRSFLQPENPAYDFAVIQLKSNITFSAKVRPICVPSDSGGDAVDFNITSHRRLSGFRREAPYDLLTTDYTLKSVDICRTNCTRSPEPRQSNPDLLDGSVLSTWHNRAWHFSGFVTTSCNEAACAEAEAFISPIAAAPSSLGWIHANVRNGAAQGYTCLDGKLISLPQLCNGITDCRQDGGSDEEPLFCQARKSTRSVGVGWSEWKVQNGPYSFLTKGGGGKLVPVQAHSTSHIEPKLSSVTQIRPVQAKPSGCPPFQPSEGVQAECRLPNSFKTDCDSTARQPTGTKVKLSCHPQYKPAAQGAASSTELNCGPQGEWESASVVRRTQLPFSCILECGHPPEQSRVPQIVNGTSTSASNWPWTAAIFRTEGERLPYVYICGATLISSSAVLTAAHCLSTRGIGGSPDPARFRIVLTPVSIEYEKNVDSTVAQVMEVSNVRIHQLYNPATFEADIAVVRIKIGANISNSIYPACYPVPGRESERIEAYQTSPGGLGLVVGFHTDEQTLQLSDQMRKVALPVVSVRDCYRVMEFFPSSSQICAGHTTGVSVCNGDSGSGLLFQEEGARGLYFVQGIVSHALALDGYHCDYNRYSIFTRVSSFKGWIEEVLSTD